MTLKERYAGIIGWFTENRPVAESELHFDSPFQLLIAVILSAHCSRPTPLPRPLLLPPPKMFCPM